MAKADPIQNPEVAPFTSARSLAARGLPVFPLVPNSKRPFLKGSFNHATKDSAQIDDWCASNSSLNIGIATGDVSGLLVIDIDDKDGKKGLESMEWLKSQNLLPPTLTAQTCSGGYHFYYKLAVTPELTCGVGFMPGADFRFNGGYVVAPPSIVDVGRYEWVNEFHPIADAPPNLISLLKARKLPAQDIHDDVIPMGKRNARLTSLAAKQVKKGRSLDEVLLFVTDANQEQCVPPLPDEEVRTIVSSVMRLYAEQDGFHFTDMGNAKRMARRYGENIRFVRETGQWLTWRGHIWKAISPIELMAMAKAIPEGLHEEADQVANDGLRKLMKKHANNSESALKLQQMIELTKSEPGIAVSVNDLDRHSFLFGVENGVVNLRTGRLEPGVRDLLMTQVSEVRFDPNATCPIFENFVRQIMGGDTELVSYLQKAVGYTMTGSVEEQCLFFLYGHGANGKSTFLNIKRALMGDYGAQAAGETLLEQNRSSTAPSVDIARLLGKRGVDLSEVEDGKQFAESTIKSMTGGDTLAARQLYKEIFEFKPKFKLWLAANHKPTIKGASYSIWRRMRLIPFAVTFDKSVQDPQLEAKMKAELPGILNWAVKGAISWQLEGLHPPKAILRATEEYRGEMDVIGTWLDECAVEGAQFRASFDELFKSYEPWCRENHNWAFSKKRFGMLLKEKGFKSRKMPQIYYHGVALRSAVKSDVLAKYDEHAKASRLFSDHDEDGDMEYRRMKLFQQFSLAILGLPEISDNERLIEESGSIGEDAS